MQFSEPYIYIHIGLILRGRNVCTGGYVLSGYRSERLLICDKDGSEDPFI